jgi:hypothetical protein
MERLTMEVKLPLDTTRKGKYVFCAVKKRSSKCHIYEQSLDTKQLLERGLKWTRMIIKQPRNLSLGQKWSYVAQTWSKHVSNRCLFRRMLSYLDRVQRQRERAEKEGRIKKTNKKRAKENEDKCATRAQQLEIENGNY